LPASSFPPAAIEIDLMLRTFPPHPVVGPLVLTVATAPESTLSALIVCVEPKLVCVPAPVTLTVRLVPPLVLMLAVPAAMARTALAPCVCGPLMVRDCEP